MTSVCLVHAPADRAFAGELGNFLETGCDVDCLLDEGVNLLDQAERLGLSGDVLVVLLSRASCAAGWPERSRWESVLINQARSNSVDVVFFQREECTFPAVFRKQFATFQCRRILKRWFWQRELATGELPATAISPDLVPLYKSVGDQPGVLYVPSALATRFAAEAAQEFAAVVWVPCKNRSLAQILGHIGIELGLTLDGPVEENRERVFKALAGHRYLVVMDGLDADLLPSLTTEGRSSALITTDAVVHLETVDSYTNARQLVLSGRIAEAYEMLGRVSQNPGMRSMCEREIAWILNCWHSVGVPAGRVFAEQMRLFG